MKVYKLSVILFLLTINVFAIDRITAKNGTFLNSKTGELFSPRGYNYVRLQNGGSEHSNFDPRYYNSAEIDAMFIDLKTNNLNIARVFLDTIVSNSLFESHFATEFYKPYITNVVDFLRRAKNNDVYVIFAFDMWGPPEASWLYIGNPNQPNVTGVNNLFFRNGSVETRTNLICSFIREIKSFDPSVLPAVFSYEVQNELHYNDNYEPLSLTNGTFTYYGINYDLSSDADKQKLMDAHGKKLLDSLAYGAKLIDANAMISANVFTFNAVGRPGPVYHSSDPTNDPRIPARPDLLAKTKTDYVDIHLYPSSSTSISEDYASISFDSVREDCARAAKPLFVGEFGANSNIYSSISSAVNVSTNSAKRFFNDGFSGWAFWTYDTFEQAGYWTSKSEDSSIFNSLLPIVQNNFYTNGVVYLSDSFDVSSGGGNVNYQLSARQSGILSTLNYVYSGNIAVTNSGTFAGKCRMNASASSANFSPDASITNNRNFIIEVNFSHQTFNSNTWFGICFGKNNSLAAPWYPSGMTIIFRDNGVYTFFDNNVEIATGNYNMSENVNVRICSSQLKYGDDALVAVYVNDLPVILNSSLGAYIVSHKSGFSTNYVTFMAYVNSDVLIDDFKISIPENYGPYISPWFADWDSGIANTNTYTHAVNFTTENDVAVNGVIFSGVGADLSGSNWELISPSNNFHNTYINDLGVDNFLSGSSFFLTTGAVYSSDYSSTLILSNLNTATPYELTVFGMGYDEDSRVYLSGSDGGIIRDFSMARFGTGFAQKITYKYYPDDNGNFYLTESSVPGNSTNQWLWFAFANRALIVVPEPNFILFILFLFFFRKSK